MIAGLQTISIQAGSYTGTFEIEGDPDGVTLQPVNGATVEIVNTALAFRLFSGGNVIRGLRSPTESATTPPAQASAPSCSTWPPPTTR
jgi:hypothetical protein